MRTRLLGVTAALLLAGVEPRPQAAAQAAQSSPPRPPGVMLDAGTLAVDVPGGRLTLVRSSQTAASLEYGRDGRFDFLPADLLNARSHDGYYHLGDIDLRLRTRPDGPWTDYSTAVARAPVAPATAVPPVLAAADLDATLPPDIPVRVRREWRLDGDRLALRFTITNRTTGPVTIGGLGLAMVFNNVLTGRSLDAAHASCVFYDPYVGLDAGYLQVARLSGKGPVLLVVPDGRTPFEAYAPILSPPRQPGPAADRAVPAPRPLTDPTPRSVTFEGFYSWMVHSRAFAEQEWQHARQWNAPTSIELAPGASVSYGVSFATAPGLRQIEPTLAGLGLPVAVGLPGYVVPTDAPARLFLKHRAPVTRVDVDPPGAVTLAAGPTTPNGWATYDIRGVAPGRVRVGVAYADGRTQTVHYLVTAPHADAAAAMGRFMTTRQWFDDPTDPFKRSPSVMTFDRETDGIVTQDNRVWVAGLGDEGGSAWLAGAVKQFGMPDSRELARYQTFIDRVLWGGLQYAEGPRSYAVRKSLFYYQPDELPPGYYRPDLNWTTWSSWSRHATEIVDRSYNYPHVAALHWTMYRLARNRQGLVTNRAWDWYLTAAYRTAIAMVEHAPRYAQFGQMGGSVFLEILRDLQREGWSQQAADLEARMRARADVWTRLAYPFGSEMPWDSTGQEEVYTWTSHFGDATKAAVTLDAIVAYMPAVPHWGYNGSARRYWDFQYAGKVRRIERQLHHYGSALNALPVLQAFRQNPDDLHLLRIGYAGMIGALANIDQEGFASAAFHAFPDMLAPDAITGDYAPGFLGHVLGAATYVAEHPEFGWQAFGGTLARRGSAIVVSPRDTFRMRVYVAPIGLWLTLDAGTIEVVEIDMRAKTVRIALGPAAAHTPEARLRIEQPARRDGVGTFSLRPSRPIERGASVIPLGAGTTWVELRHERALRSH